MHAAENWIRLALISEANPTSALINVMAGDGDFTVAYTARWQRAHLSTSLNSSDDQIPTLRDAIVASTRREVSDDSMFAPRHDDQDDW